MNTLPEEHELLKVGINLSYFHFSDIDVNSDSNLGGMVYGKVQCSKITNFYL